MLEVPTAYPIDMTSTASSSTLKNSLYWLIANALGMCIYLAAESYELAPRPQYQELSGLDIICFWLSKELPLLCVFLVSNIVWLTLIIKNRRLTGNRKPLRVWILVCLLWVAIVFSHGMGIEMLQVLANMVIRR